MVSGKIIAAGIAIVAGLIGFGLWYNFRQTHWYCKHCMEWFTDDEVNTSSEGPGKTIWIHCPVTNEVIGQIKPDGSRIQF